MRFRTAPPNLNGGIANESTKDGREDVYLEALLSWPASVQEASETWGVINSRHLYIACRMLGI